jgi:6-methylsalicylate decarboxylase
VSAGRIDTHSHVVPPDYADWLRDHLALAGGLPIPSWDAVAALDVMDNHGIAAAVLSVSTPGVHLGDGADARAMARHVNDFAAQVVRDHPGRFGFFATLPLPDVDGALAELDRCFDELDADGVVLLANHRGTYLGDPAFDPVFDELQRRAAVAFVHPSTIPGLDPVDGIPTYVADFLLDTTRAAVNLARRGTLERCPDVRIVLSHAGGIVPYAAHRLALAASPRDHAADGLALLRRFYFDVALSSTPTALPSLLAFTTPDHVTYGSDWPYAPEPAVAGMARLYERFDLDPEARRQIDRDTAAGLFPRFAQPG